MQNAYNDTASNTNNLEKINMLGNLFVGFLHENSASLMELIFELQEKESNNRTRIIKIAKNLTKSLSQTRELINDSPRCRFNAAKEVNNALSLMSNQLKSKNIIVVKDLKDIELIGYPVIFRQIIICVLLNSVQAFKKASRKNKIFISIELIGNDLRLVIEDNAGGESQKSIKKDNTGLGLYFVKKAALKYFNTDINLRIIKGIGCVFTFVVKIK